eukprot:9319685-Alexandrium_andersonii.AAC.1
MSASLVGSEMCIRDRLAAVVASMRRRCMRASAIILSCRLADRQSVDALPVFDVSRRSIAFNLVA